MPSGSMSPPPKSLAELDLELWRLLGTGRHEDLRWTYAELMNRRDMAKKFPHGSSRSVA